MQIADADVRMASGRGQPDVYKSGQGGGELKIIKFLRTPFMDGPLGLHEKPSQFS